MAYLTLWERKLIGWIQIRIGPNRVGPLGLLQPIADGIKLLFKEIIFPTNANKALFVLAPVLTLMPALAAWAVIPFAPNLVLADINAGLLYIMALTSMGVYGVIIAGWASNSKYAFLGAMRSAAQMVSYELAMGFALVVVLMVSRQPEPVRHRRRRRARAGSPRMGLNFLSWNWLPLAADAAGVFRLGHRRDQPRALRRRRGRVRDRRRPHGRVLRHGLRAVLPRRVHEHAGDLDAHRDHVLRRLAAARRQRADQRRSRRSSGCCAKVFVVVSMFLWIRATFPRYRYDQIMRLGWKIFIPLTLVWIVGDRRLDADALESLEMTARP